MKFSKKLCYFTQNLTTGSKASVSIFIVLCLLSLYVFSADLYSNAKAGNTDTVLIKNGAGRGHDLLIPRKPQRVVILSPSSLEPWIKLGGRDKIIAVSAMTSGSRQEVYDQLSPQTKILGMAAYRNPELFITLKPDLVILSGYEAAQDFIGEFLKREHIPLMTMPNQSIADTYREIALFGTLLDNQQQAQTEITRIQDNIAANQKQYSQYPTKNALLIFGTPASFAMFTPATRQSDMLTMACARNIVPKEAQFLGAKYLPMSLEYATLKRPDHVFFINHGNAKTMAKKTREALDDSSSWKTIRAIKQGQVTVLPPEYFMSNPALRMDSAVRRLSEILYAGGANE